MLSVGRARSCPQPLAAVSALFVRQSEATCFRLQERYMEVDAGTEKAVPPFDSTRVNALSRFPCLRLAREAMAAGGPSWVGAAEGAGGFWIR